MKADRGSTEAIPGTAGDARNSAKSENPQLDGFSTSAAVMAADGSAGDGAGPERGVSTAAIVAILILLVLLVVLVVAISVRQRKRDSASTAANRTMEDNGDSHEFAVATESLHIAAASPLTLSQSPLPEGATMLEHSAIGFNQGIGVVSESDDDAVTWTESDVDADTVAAWGFGQEPAASYVDTDATANYATGRMVYNNSYEEVGAQSEIKLALDERAYNDRAAPATRLAGPPAPSFQLMQDENGASFIEL